MAFSRRFLTVLTLTALVGLAVSGSLQAQRLSSAEIFHKSVLGAGYVFLKKDNQPDSLEISHYQKVEGNKKSVIRAMAQNGQLLEVNFDTPRQQIAQPFQQAVGMAFAALLYTTRPGIFQNKQNFEKIVDAFAEKMAVAWEQGGNQDLEHNGVQVSARITPTRIVQKMWVEQ